MQSFFVLKSSMNSQRTYKLIASITILTHIMIISSLRLTPASAIQSVEFMSSIHLILVATWDLPLHHLFLIEVELHLYVVIIGVLSLLLLLLLLRRRSICTASHSTY